GFGPAARGEQESQYKKRNARDDRPVQHHLATFTDLIWDVKNRSPPRPIPIARSSVHHASRRTGSPISAYVAPRRTSAASRGVMYAGDECRCSHHPCEAGRV